MCRVCVACRCGCILSAGHDHHTVAAVAAQVRQRAHRRRVVALDEVSGPVDLIGQVRHRLVELRPPDVFWATRGWVAARRQER